MRSHVLVVDDEAMIRRLLRETLEDEGLEVAEAANGSEALSAWPAPDHRLT